jgi:ABC-type branched-subunit amino acid transport system substrate-binding protein
MISPSASAPGALLRGRRAFARVVAADDVQAQAGARALARAGDRRVFVLEDGGGYGGDAAGFFAVAAREAGLRIVGRGRFTTAGLVPRIRRARADAVFVGGLLDTGAGRVVRRLRAGLGEDVTLLGPDGLLPVAKLFEAAGPAAQGVLITTEFPPLEALPPGGRRFAARLARDLHVGRVEPLALYAAQATQVALDAIRRSDGSRASVAAALARTDLTDGWIGRVRFTRDGDLREPPVAVMRAERGGGSAENLSTEGAELVRLDR